ncbi:MAG: hypothetical protein RBU27_08055 [Bacteroidota bacterium]|jgi:hypothetical protein|nr:hypothetical protein [Bacteroidota bacterium]
MKDVETGNLSASHPSTFGHWIGHGVAVLAILVGVFLHFDAKPPSAEDLYTGNQESHIPKLLSKDTARIEGTATHTVLLTVAMEKWQNRFDSARWADRRQGLSYTQIPNLKWYSQAEIIDCVVPLNFNIVNVSPDEPAKILFEVIGSVEVDNRFDPYKELISGKWIAQIDTIIEGTENIIPAQNGEHEVKCMLSLRLKNNTSRVYYMAVYQNAAGQYYYTHTDLICKYDIPLDDILKLNYQPGTPDITWSVGPSDTTATSLVPSVQAGSNFFRSIPFEHVDRVRLTLDAMTKKPKRTDET